MGSGIFLLQFSLLLVDNSVDIISLFYYWDRFEKLKFLRETPNYSILLNKNNVLEAQLKE